MKKEKILAFILSASMFLSTSVGSVSFAEESADISISQQEISEVQQSPQEEEQSDDRTDLSEPEEVNRREINQKQTPEVFSEDQEDESESEIATQADRSESEIAMQADAQTQQMVYLSVLTGNDDQDGTSSKPVKTLKKALEKVAENGTIVITGQIDNYWNNNAVVITEDTVINKGVTILRGQNCGQEMFSVQSGTLTIENATIDSQYNAGITQSNGAVKVDGGNLIINNGAKICNAGYFGVWINNNGTFTMNGGEISNNGIHDLSLIYTGGVLMGSGTFTMNGGSIHDNVSKDNWEGAGVKVNNGATFHMLGGEISNNATETAAGGAIYTEGIVHIEGGTLSNNTGNGNGGGAIYAYNSTVTIGDGVQITGNKATGDDSGGGAIALSGSSSLTVGKAIISNNSAQYGGGIASWSQGTIKLNGTTISDNTALSTTGWGTGGGISINNSGTLNMNDAAITGNQSLQGGGVGAYNTATVNINGKTVISDNTVTGNGGGGLYGYGSSQFTVGDDTKITNNHATGENSGGGAVAIAQTATFTIGRAILDGNDAQYGGGIASWSQGTTTLNGTTVSNNTALSTTGWGNGGGISINNTGTLNINDATISGNQSMYGGGVGAYDTAVVNVNGNTSINNNRTTESGGGGVAASGSSVINLNSATISANEAPFGSGVGVWNSAEIIMKDAVSIVQNIATSVNTDAAGGAVYVSGFEKGGSRFVMEGGTVQNNTSTGGIHCAGIFIEGYRDTALAQIKGGTISNNKNENGDDQGIVIKAAKDDSGNVYLGKLELSGSPTITGQVLLRKDISEDIKVDVVDTFEPTQPVAIDIYNNEWINHRVIVTFADGLTPDESLFKPYQESPTQAIIQNKQDLECMNKVQVIFKNEDGTTNKEMYVLPGTKIDKTEVPTVSRPGYKFKYWKYGQDGTEWDFSQKEITDEVTVFVPEWEKDSQSHKVKYNTNSSEKIEDVEVNTGDKAEKPKITAKGKFISGWYTTEDFKEGTEWNFDDPITEDITLHAKWELNKPTGTLEAEGGITTVHIGKTVKLKATANHDATDEITYSYQWFKDGKALGGKARAKEGTNEKEVDETGDYTVKVTASDGTLTSSAEFGPVRVTVTDHSYTGEWKHDEKQHWKECDECGEKGQDGEHTFGEWTTLTGGKRERACTVCGYKVTETVPSVKKYGVIYKFISGKDSKALPKEVTDLLPQDKTEYENGTKVTPKAPTQTTVTVSGGKWTFAGYDANEKIVAGEVTFTGVWNYTKDGATEPINTDPTVKPSNDTSKSDMGTNGNVNSMTSTTGVSEKISAKTGDTANIAVYGIFAGVCVLIFLQFARRKKKL